MSKAEIIAELPRLSPEERAKVQAKLDELAGEAWQDRGELSEADRRSPHDAIAAYEKLPLVAIHRLHPPAVDHKASI